MSSPAPQPDLLEQAARIVDRAIALCGERSGWTKKYFARDRSSHPVQATSPRATRFCLAGALIRAGGEELGIELPTSLEPAIPWTPEMEEPEYPPALRLAFRACGEICVLLLQQVIKIERGESGLPVVTGADGRQEGPLPWPVVVSAFNEAATHQLIVRVLEATSRDLARAPELRRLAGEASGRDEEPA